jgi:TolB protein
MMRHAWSLLLWMLSTVQLFAQAAPLPDSLHDPGEWRLRNIRQLTFEGENAEAYLSFDERMLCFQSRTSRRGCDQIFIMDTGGTYRKRISPGLGRTTCAYLLPDGRLLYATTHLADSSCPPPPDYSQGYVWPVYPTYDIVIADTATGAILQRLTITDGYDAEATVSPTGDRIVFTSARDGDLELYSCALDGSDLRRLTFTPGYDGGAFFSFDGKRIVYRAHHPQGAELEEYRQLLRKHLVRPTRMELFVMDADGSNVRQITNNGAANFAPFFHPDGRRIIFSSNLHNPTGRNFDLYIINIDGTGLERVTYFEGFDGFPMFTRDGKKLVFCSNRNARKPGDTNIFIADWVEEEPPQHQPPPPSPSKDSPVHPRQP